jgi:hypothetical protein
MNSPVALAGRGKLSQGCGAVITTCCIAGFWNDPGELIGRPGGSKGGGPEGYDHGFSPTESSIEVTLGSMFGKLEASSSSSSTCPSLTTRHSQKSHRESNSSRLVSNSADDPVILCRSCPLGLIKTIPITPSSAVVDTDVDIDWIFIFSRRDSQVSLLLATLGTLSCPSRQSSHKRSGYISMIRPDVESTRRQANGRRKC